MVQVYVLLAIAAQITGLKPGRAYHKIVNAHIYEDQFVKMKEQLEREPKKAPKFYMSPLIKTLEDVETCTIEDFNVLGYDPHPPISFPFSV